MADLLEEHLADGLPVRGDRREQRKDVGNADIVHAATVQIRRKGEPREDGIPAVRGAVDRDPFRIGDALREELPDAVGDVVLHGASPLFESGLPEGLSVPGGATEVHLKDGGAPVDEELNFGVEAPGIPRPRSTVRQDDDGKVFRFGIERQRQVSANLQSVPRRIFDRLHPGHLVLLEPRSEVGQLFEAFFPRVVEPVGSEFPVAVRYDEPSRFVLAPVDDGNLLVRQPGFEVFLQVLPLVVEKGDIHLVRHVGHARQDLPLLRPEQPAHVDVGVFEDELAQPGGLRVVFVDRELVAIQVRRDEELRVVEREEKRVQAVPEVRRQNGRERRRFRFPVEKARVHAVGRQGDPQSARVIGHPPRDVARIFRDHGHFSGVDVQPVHVEHAVVPLVQADEHFVRVVLKIVDDGRADARKGRQLLEIRAVRVDREDVVVLIPGVVLEKDDAAVAGPEESGDIPIGRRRQSQFGVRADRSDEDVHASFPGLEIGETRSVGREPEHGRFGVAEEVLHRNEPRRGPRAGGQERDGKKNRKNENGEFRVLHEYPPVCMIVSFMCMIPFHEAGETDGNTQKTSIRPFGFRMRHPLKRGVRRERKAFRKNEKNECNVATHS